MMNDLGKVRRMAAYHWQIRPATLYISWWQKFSKEIPLPMLKHFIKTLVEKKDIYDFTFFKKIFFHPLLL